MIKIDYHFPNTGGVFNTPSYPAYSVISGNVAYVLIPL